MMNEIREKLKKNIKNRKIAIVIYFIAHATLFLTGIIPMTAVFIYVNNIKGDVGITMISFLLMYLMWDISSLNNQLKDLNEKSKFKILQYMEGYWYDENINEKPFV